jgi:EAL and modified HD-GYP domain-containing signal transduction protein
VEVFLARQPILDRDLRVCGYELLYRSCRNGAAAAPDPVLASRQVLSEVLLGFGLEPLLGGKLGFVNFPRELLVEAEAFPWPRNSLVIEILESVAPDAEVTDACRRLQANQYLLALDDVGPETPTLALADFVRFIKVDFAATSSAGRKQLVRRYGRPGRLMLAEKLETQADFLRARHEGFHRFQGYFFARPVILARREIPVSKFNHLRLLAEVQRPVLDFRRIGLLLKGEVGLCHRFLRYLNSALFGMRGRITSIQRGLTLLGEEGVRRWVALAALPTLAADKPGALVETAVIRAEFCELLAPQVGLGARRSELFLMGMFSLLDAIIGRPLEEILEEIGLADDIRDALVDPTGVPSPLRSVHCLVTAYERGDWPAVATAAEAFGLAPESVAKLYLEAVRRHQALFRRPQCEKALPAP